MPTMAMKIEVASTVYAWARLRSGLAPEELDRKFPNFDRWESGRLQPTLKQLESFAQATNTPIGFFFLDQPPSDDELPVPDFRTIQNRRVRRPTANLLQTVYDCQQRQEWYAEYLRTNREEPAALVGSATTSSDIIATALSIRNTLNFAPSERGSTWSEAFRRLADRSEDTGILVMVNGVVGSNTHRKLDPQEFRGFSLVDRYAPLVFVNGADTKGAQIFTLAHELAHVWLGESGVDDIDLSVSLASGIESWCNAVAAEFLVPLELLDGRDLDPDLSSLTGQLEAIAAEFKVSTLVALSRLRDIGQITAAQFREHFDSELARVLTLRDQEPVNSGGNFYNTQLIRTSKRFTRALVTSTVEGQTLRRDAYQLLGFKKSSTFDELARRLDVI
jgi:Zn-dependent peptidase ImmA (M78 family)/transcriptional regulator with XRE-family HTH domain